MTAAFCECAVAVPGAVPAERVARKIVSGYTSGNQAETQAMPDARTKAQAVYRKRLKRRGVARIEVHVGKRDAALVRAVVKALGDPARAAEARAVLRERFGAGEARGLKALLAAAPLEGIDLARDRDFGRDVAL
jgi:hypothetical protein